MSKVTTFQSSGATVCRMCLAVNVHMHTISNTPMQETYERMTNILLQDDRSEPVKACYICHHLLQRIRAFTDSSLRADELLRYVYRRELELTETTIASLGADLKSTLAVSPTDHISIGLPDQWTAMPIKHEPPDVKSEIDIEENEIEEKESKGEPAPEQIKLHEGTPVPEELLIPIEKIEEPRMYLTNDTKKKDLKKKKSSLSLEILKPSEVIEVKIKPRGKRMKSDEKPNKTFKIRERTKKLLSCRQCCKEFCHIRTFKKHLRIHTGEKPYNCEFCSKAFRFDCDLVRHLRIHSGEKPYNCHKCKKDFRYKSALNSHIKTHKGYRPYVCHICDKAFSRNFNLISHIRTHTGEKPYNCCFCGKSFRYTKDLNVHLRKHTGKEPLTCECCGIESGCRSDLIVHMRTHTGEKPFICHHCGKAFRQKYQVKNHMRRHMGKDPYKCDQCKKTFNEKNSFTRHLRLHTGEKPFKCHQCVKTFNEKKNLNRHLRSHTGEKPYTCDVCNGKFTEKKTLISHIKRAHT